LLSLLLSKKSHDEKEHNTTKEYAEKRYHRQIDTKSVVPEEITFELEHMIAHLVQAMQERILG
jgi:hypothetical protein